jgi:hypothetical protein
VIGLARILQEIERIPVSRGILVFGEHYPSGHIESDVELHRNQSQIAQGLIGSLAFGEIPNWI